MKEESYEYAGTLIAPVPFKEMAFIIQQKFIVVKIHRSNGQGITVRHLFLQWQ